MATIGSQRVAVNAAHLKPYKWAFETSEKRPMRPRCAGCDAPHGRVVWRLKAKPEIWWPGPEQPPCEHEYHATPNRIDLTVSDFCSFCVKQQTQSRRSA